MVREHNDRVRPLATIESSPHHGYCRFVAFNKTYRYDDTASAKPAQVSRVNTIKRERDFYKNDLCDVSIEHQYFSGIITETTWKT